MPRTSVWATIVDAQALRGDEHGDWPAWRRSVGGGCSHPAMRHRLGQFIAPAERLPPGASLLFVVVFTSDPAPVTGRYPNPGMVGCGVAR
jgi:hypothetical protein